MTSPGPGAEPAPRSHTRDPEEEANKPDLDALEENKARQEESLDQKITYDVIRREGDKELERPLSGLWWAAVAGGMSMDTVKQQHAEIDRLNAASQEFEDVCH